MPKDTTRKPRFQLPPLPGEQPRHQPCQECPRCASGRDQQATRDGDCWDEYLTGVMQSLSVREKRRTGDAEGARQSCDQVDANVVAPVLGAADGFHIDTDQWGELLLGEAAGLSDGSDTVTD